MKPGAPWSIKGIDPDAREAAKEKARAAGMTLGQWLNATITGSAEATRSAVPPPSAAPGSALDTARIMRAIAELARRVDVLAVGGGDTAPDTARIEQQLETLERKLTELSQAPQPGVDQARLERGMISIARRIEAVESTVRESLDIETLRDSVNHLDARVAALPDSLATSEQAAGPDLSRIEASLDRLEERLKSTEVGLADLAATSTREEATGDAATGESIRKLMNGMVNLSRMMEGLESRIAEKAEHQQRQARDLIAAEQQAMTETLARLEKAQGDRDTEASALQLRAHVQAAMAPLAESIGHRIDELEDAFQGNRSTTAAAEPAETPEEPAATQEADTSVQYDTTDLSRIEPVITEATDEPILLDTPAPPETPPAASSRALRDSEMDAVLQQEPLPAALMDDDDAFFREVPREQPLPDYPVDPTPTGDSQEQSEPAPQADPDPTLPDDTDDQPERPVGLLPVEELLADAPGETATPTAPADPSVAVPAGGRDLRDDNERRPFRLDEPLDLSRQPPPEPARNYPGRRRWIGYLVFALIFLGLLVAGYWFVGTQQYRDLSRQIGGMWDNAMVGATGLDEEAAGTGAPSATEDVARSTDATATTSAPAPAPATDTATAAPAAAPAVPVDTGASSPTAPAPPPQPDAAPASPLERLTAQANSGDPDAQYALGVRTRDGVGIEPNYSTAADWFDLAAQQGHVKAQLGLGIMYRQGLGRAQDLDLAKVWLHAAARAGDADAQKYLGEVYVDDRAGVPDYFQAARWFREAAEQGLVDAQYNMGVLYEGGLGVPRDFEQAYYWFFLARQAGDQTANEDLARVAALLTPEQRTAIEGRSSSFAPATGAPAPALPSTSATGDGDDVPLNRRDQIKQLQSLLVARGYDPGAADGLPGAKTRDAIQQWQRDTGRVVKGQITEQVLQALASGN